LVYVFHPDWPSAPGNTVVPSVPLGDMTSSPVFLVIAIVGVTIAPWQLFFQQSCVAEKRLRFADLRWARLDTLILFCRLLSRCPSLLLCGRKNETYIA
jgi:Mn2+/Fe2+ NRAMP family transporter